MNSYGRQAKQHWQQYLPRQYAQIVSPEAFFRQMGETIAQQIEDLTEQIAGPDRPGETFMAKLGRLNMAKQEATIEVMRQTLPQPETQTS
jgi:hypothetical protein